MLAFYDVPFLRNTSIACDTSRVTSLLSRMTEELVVRTSRLLLKMLAKASSEVCHDVA